MTKEREALKLALEALEWFTAAEQGEEPPITKTITAIKEVLAQLEQELTNLERHERNVQQLFGTPQPKEQEPVAWRAWFDADNSAKWLFTLWPEEEHPSFDWQPLYTHPPVPTAQPKEPEQEPVAEVVIGKYPWDYGLSVVYLEKCLLAGTKLYTTPPQRTWVGLTPDEIRGISLASGKSLFSAIMFTHDKLKEKNA